MGEVTACSVLQEALKQGRVESVAEATELRLSEHEEYTELERQGMGVGMPWAWAASMPAWIW